MSSAGWILLTASTLILSMLPDAVSAPQVMAQDFPALDKLPAMQDMPDPLVMRDGTRVTTPAQWQTQRKPELKALFQHYMYGVMPPAPKISATVRSVNRQCLDGKATLKQISIAFGPPGCPTIELMLIVPNQRRDATPPPVFLGLNFGSNHTVLEDKTIELPRGWMPDGPGVEAHRATDAGRGKAADNWVVEHVVERGYAVATFYTGDIAPDTPDFSKGVFPYFQKPGQTARAADAWSVIAAWAWGLQRAVDYLVTDADVDAHRIIVFGHSRKGKAALLAGAFDERVAAIIPHQAGCGGSAPSRCHNDKAETVSVINAHFPHWFNDNFHAFGGHEAQLPFDQNCLVALCAPRPVLLTTGTEDQWANPPGQFDVLLSAKPVYRLLGVEGMADTVTAPVMDTRVGTQLNYYIRDAKHGVNRVYWDVFMDFADQTIRPPK